jgi:hypothetical protein
VNRIPNRWAIGLGVVGLAAAVLFFAEPGDVLTIDSYELVEPATIHVRTSAGSAAWTRVTEVTETASRVQIAVKSWGWPVPQSNFAHPLELTVMLDAPLGDRQVTDGVHVEPWIP